MELQEGIARLFARLGAAPPPPDEDGGYTVAFEDGTDLHLESRDGCVFLHGDVAPALPRDDKGEEACRKLLRKSLGRALEWPETLFLDDAAQRLRLVRRLPEDARPFDLPDACEQFLNRLAWWKRQAAAP